MAPRRAQAKQAIVSHESQLTTITLEIGGVQGKMELDPRRIDLFGGTQQLVDRMRARAIGLIKMSQERGEFTPTSIWIRKQMELCLQKSPESWGYQAYELWCEENGLEAVNEAKFNQEEGSLKESIAKRFKYIVENGIKVNSKLTRGTAIAKKTVTGFTPDCRLKLKSQGTIVNDSQKPDDYRVLS